MQITRHCPGYYTAKQGEYSVIIDYLDHLQGDQKWIVKAEWDQYRYTDPVSTYREAKQDAQEMLDTAEEF